MAISQAEHAINSLGLKEQRLNYSFYSQNEISNDDLITAIQNIATGSFSSNQDGLEESELFVFADNSCITRNSDEYFIHENVDFLDNDYLNAYIERGSNLHNRVLNKMGCVLNADDSESILVSTITGLDNWKAADCDIV